MERIIDKNIIDYDRGLARFMGKQTSYDKFLRSFAADENYILFINAMAINDYANALRAIHTLKGVSGNLSMIKLYEACSEMVTALRNGREYDYPLLCAGVQKSYELTCQTLKKFFSED